MAQRLVHQEVKNTRFPLINKWAQQFWSHMSVIVFTVILVFFIITIALALLAISNNNAKMYAQTLAYERAMTEMEKTKEQLISKLNVHNIYYNQMTAYLKANNIKIPEQDND